MSGTVLRNAQGTPIPAGTLLQLVDLGADGLFNVINLTDGGNQWVSGDDRLLSVNFESGVPGDFQSTDAFDLFAGADTAGELERVFQFAPGAIASGKKLGIRWFPGIMATDFGSTTLQLSQTYGEFTRQAFPLHGGSLWIQPNEGSNIAFDPLVTQSADGLDPESSGFARAAAIPEPTVSLYGCTILLTLALAGRKRAAE